MKLFGDLLSILRFHIIGVSMAAALVFGWLFSGRYLIDVALVGGLDWLLINLFNRVTDLEEDLQNEIRGTDRVARNQRFFTVGAFALLIGSFVLTHLVRPELTPLRVVVQLIGLGYSYAIVPAPGGFKRIKQFYFFKNFMSAVIFCLTVFAYPLTVNHFGADVPGGLAGAAMLVAFFVPFELTYEILYDMRDLEGDRAVGIPTYPVVHGLAASRRIVDGLLLASCLPLCVGLALGWLGVREGLMLAAPLVQLLAYRPCYRRGLTSRDCIGLTHLGSALLLFYLLGTRVWLSLGLPPNLHL